LKGNYGAIDENNKKGPFLDECHPRTLEAQFMHVRRRGNGGHVTHARLPAVHWEGDTPRCLINMDDCVARQDSDSAQRR
jgi:hypothetical protein